MLTGEPPFVANSTPAILVKHISERPIPVEQRRGDVPQDLSRVIMILLEKDPANRFPSASAVVAALDTGRIPQIDRAPTPVPVDNAPLMVPRRSSSSYPVPSTEDTYGGVPAPSFDELRRLETRWEATPVKNFRRKLAPYLFVNGVIVIASIVGDSDFFGITVLWSIYLAFKYAKLWADGYDWRDVFRQPRDRDLIDVADDTLTYVRAVMDRDQRKAMREQRRARMGRTGSSEALPSMSNFPSGTLGVSSTYADRVRAAESDRGEILMRLSRMSSSERARVPDVERSAVALADKCVVSRSCCRTSSARPEQAAPINWRQRSRGSRAPRIRSTNRAAMSACGGSRISSVSGARSLISPVDANRLRRSSTHAWSRSRTSSSISFG
jgi:serine/threonine-protein kinase